ncbi:MAG: sigma factor-like helix-turn-helix DNA-binding protein [Minisyncoccia bacterium]
MANSPKGLALLAIKQLNSRGQNIIKKRFGIFDNKPKTLEAIGKEYHITRERVRQIIDSLIKNLKSVITLESLKQFYDLCLKLLEENNGLYEKEEFLLKINEAITKNDEKQAIYFLLTLNPEFILEKESDHYLSFWHLKSLDSEKVKKDIKTIEKYLQQKKKSFNLEEILDFAKKYINKNISEKLLNTYLKLAKNIKRNIFGEYGYVSLSEINPTGAGERAYLIMKHLKKPMHFSEIAKKINEIPEDLKVANTSSRWFRKVQIQTVHNELIRDQRFVLIGRGIYALRDWGYKPGKVVDVIKEVLAKAKKPLTQKQIIEEVKKQRLAKDNTIILNLHNKKYFKKLPDKKFILAYKKETQPKVMEI